MKKYVKPELFYEKFELSQHIASCAIPLNYDSVNSCSVRSDDINGMAGLFTGDSCSEKLPEGATEEYCYMPTSDGTLFGS